MEPTEGKKIATASLWRAIGSPQSIANISVYQPELYLRRFLSHATFHAHTMLLFTWTDYKTIFIPVVSIHYIFMFFAVVEDRPHT